MVKKKKSKTDIRETNIEHKNKTLHYRYAELKNYEGDLTLSDLLKKALVNLPLVKNRYQIINEDTHDPDEDGYKKSRLFINNKAISWNIVFGDLMRYSDGTNKSTVTIDDDAEHLEIESIAPPQSSKGKRREFLDSILYFGVFKNHLAIIQSAVLRTSELERHLYWLLREAEVIDKDVYVVLTTKIPEQAKKKLQNSDTKTLKIGAPLVDSVNNKSVADLQEVYSEEQKFDAKKISVQPKGLGLNWLLSAFGDMEKLKSYGITDELLSEDAVNGSSINISLEISYKRKASKQSQSIINSVSTAMRHAHPDDISIDYGKVGRLSGRQLVLHKKLNLRYVDGVMDAQDLYPKIQEWLIEQISVEELDAE
ncbi:conserved hypothetical protein [Vibrio nigripulchritudo SO65]|uniref:hypothetical protein n=1 Tax=Vibrio nigripulchritudo TaxID=28173 RepID=UPI0003B19AD9|nr:hypothetical protein [Vibrio nigripulchritudo]CCN32786.1 conserved hypothetical protein [Vibrio nigripulchritudo AM115]CCN43588.1 conserved hypothetical protein [Vibrio nigripulchritudo FTn2]CCN63389.1 conserved hypothetical protein [Vibrio nigripulchritudo POn4]CCN78719.1 conserved hypothetical protein [Vibrio nigripulchritudo SO65]